MIYLLLAVLCSSAIGIIFKISENRSSNRFVVTSSNYFAAVLFSGFLLWQADIDLTMDVNWIDFMERLIPTLLSRGIQFSYGDSIGWAILLGIVSGWVYFIAFIFYQISVNKNGVALSAMFSRLGILFPLLISIIVWLEIPTMIQSIGIFFCLFSIFLVNFNFKEGEKFQVNSSLLLLAFIMGFAIFCSKLFQNYALLDLKPVFIFCLFLSALLISLTASVKYLKVAKRSEIFIGLAVGVPNMLNSWFLVQALGSVKASIAFPIFGAGSIILMTLAAVIFFKEKIMLKNGIAILLTAFALVLLNL